MMTTILKALNLPEMTTFSDLQNFRLKLYRNQFEMIC